MLDLNFAVLVGVSLAIKDAMGKDLGRLEDTGVPPRKVTHAE